MAVDRFTLDPGIRALLHDLGLSVSRVLRQGQLPAGVFLAGSPSLSAQEYYRFWDAVDSEGGDADLAVRIGRSISVEVFNPPIFAALCSANLHVAAERVSQFKPLIGPVALEVTFGRRGLTVGFRWPDGPPPPRLLAASELAFWVALARIGTRHEVYPTAVTMRRPYEGSEEFEAYFGTTIRKGALDTVTFAAEDAIRPFMTENESMWTFFEPELRRRLSDLAESASTADRVRAALHETLPSGDSSIHAVAKQLILSPRTLQRQLQTEGTSYQAVLTDTRERLARRYLNNKALTTAQIAYLLAYEDTNSFYRAFRRWTGVTPDAARP
ncbi:AraC family transcriptional regulator [Acidothermaceae bacterium B102]|nr:AraC family transcriptional regulator [Acidothermaceae bacterium B102]